jgi:hypothetical protein
LSSGVVNSWGFVDPTSPSDQFLTDTHHYALGFFRLRINNSARLIVRDLMLDVENAQIALYIMDNLLFSLAEPGRQLALGWAAI